MTHATEHVASHTLDAAISAGASKATYTGVGMTLGGWFFSSEFAVLMGVVIGVAGLMVNWYYKHKLTMIEIRLQEEQAAREREAHAARMGMWQ